MLLAGASLLAAPLLPGVNAAVLALALGLIVANAGGGEITIDPRALRFFTDRVLKAAVILLGATMDLTRLAGIGPVALLAITAGIGTAFAVAWLVGGRVGLASRPRLLVGVGTAICGASAIAAVAPILRARQEEMGVALATIYMFNGLALLAYPALGHLVGMTPPAFGIWAGVGIHDTAAAVSAGFLFGGDAGPTATAVKLTRTLFLLPLVALLQLATSRVDHRGRATLRAFPWFVVGFVALAALNSAGWLGWAQAAAGLVIGPLIVSVVAAVGLTLRLSYVARLGRPLFITGLLSGAAVGLTGLGIVELLRG